MEPLQLSLGNWHFGCDEVASIRFHSHDEHIKVDNTYKTTILGFSSKNAELWLLREEKHTGKPHREVKLHVKSAVFWKLEEKDQSLGLPRFIGGGHHRGKSLKSLYGFPYVPYLIPKIFIQKLRLLEAWRDGFRAHTLLEKQRRKTMVDTGIHIRLHEACSLRYRANIQKSAKP